MEAGIAEIEWVPLSPDMNCIHNCWCIMSRAFYEGGLQFDSVDYIREALIWESENISIEDIKKLKCSMPRMGWYLCHKHGGATEYLHLCNSSRELEV